MHSICRQSRALPGGAHFVLGRAAIAIRIGAHEAVAELGIEFVGGEHGVLIGIERGEDSMMKSAPCTRQYVGASFTPLPMFAKAHLVPATGFGAGKRRLGSVRCEPIRERSDEALEQFALVRGELRERQARGFERKQVPPLKRAIAGADSSSPGLGGD